MAKRQITIDDGSKGRKQVELNLNPVNLQPTINSGGNYRVAVQQTPKTNSALQLAENLKKGVKVYGQAVKLAQAKAEDDVAKMTDEEYDKFLTEGLDPDAKNLFGYTKTYNQMLAQKYYAEEVPNKLQDISTEMFSNYYDYKDAATFEAALNEKTQGVYDEADALLNDNVFGNEANRVLKNATQNDFVTKERAKFIQELPKRNAELGTQAINRNIEEIDDSVLAQGLFGKTTRDIYSTNAGSFRTPQEANEAFYNSVFTRIQTLAESNSTADNKLAEDMLAQIGDGKSVEGIDRTVGGMDIFATGKRQLALTKLESALENKMDTAYEDAVKAVQVPLASAQARVIRELATGASESEVRANINGLIEDLESPDGLAKYPDDTERNLLTIGLRGMLDNTKYFKNEHIKNYWLNNQTVYETTLKMAVDNIPEAFTEATSSMANAPRKPVGIGEQFVTAAQFKLTDLYTDIAIQVSDIEGSTERLLKFKELEKAIIPEFNSWRDDYFNQASIVTQQTEAAKKQSLIDEAKTYKPNADDYADNPQALKAIIQDGKAGSKRETIDGDKNVRGFFFDNQFDNFVKASNKQIIDGDDLKRNFNDIHENFNESGLLNYSKQRELGTKLSTSDAPFGLPRYTGLERVEIAQELASHYQVAGIDSESLLSGAVPSDKKKSGVLPRVGGNRLTPMPFTAFFDDSGLTFDEFPIVVDGDIQNTIDAVDAYFKAKNIDQLDIAFSGPFQAIADKYGISLGLLMIQQRSYLQNYNYIESK